MLFAFLYPVWQSFFPESGMNEPTLLKETVGIVILAYVTGRVVGYKRFRQSMRGYLLKFRGVIDELLTYFPEEK